jgi:cytoskeletal protein CcmA (bactofilin family)
MFNRGTTSGKARMANDPMTTVLGEGTHWQGEIQAGPNGLRIEGEVEGTVISEGQVLVAPSGSVRGTIHAKRLTVMGRVEGVFKVEGCLEILGTGWVEGEVELENLVVDEGGTLQGTCARHEAPKAKEPMPLLPRKDEAPQERFQHLPSGTAHDTLPPGRGLGRSRF